jgi:hypothetical protein
MLHSEKSIVKILLLCTIVTLLAAPLHIIPQYTSSAASYSKSGIVIPLFSYPGSNIQEIAQIARDYPSVPIIAIVNPQSGPGGSYSSTYANAIQELRSAGVTVIGYVSTEYASVSISSAETQVNLYHSWYADINGIFFDQMSNVHGNEGYYSTLKSYVHSNGMTIAMGNPGTSVPSSFIGTMDVICIHEDGSYLSISSIASRTMGYPKSNFAYMEYGMSLPSDSYVTSVANYIQWIYFTNGAWPTPYSALPSYLSSLASYLSETQGGASASAPSSGAVTVQIDSSYGGSLFNGMWTVVQSGGRTITSGFTPLSFSATPGTQYVVSISNYGKYIFNHWSTGSTSGSITMSPTQATTLTAYYGGDSSNSGGGTASSGTVSITVRSVTASDSAFSGMYTVFRSSSGSILGTAFTTATFDADSGSSYQICVDNYGNVIFQHWSDGYTSSCRTITPTESTTLEAVYST